MPKRKDFLNAKKKGDKKRKNELPESENEYLAAGVDFEEAGEKWRAGDTAKSLRFFVRATETYDDGLRKFPQSFDLAYNKARLQYEVAQQPRLRQHLPTPLIELLEIALDSHRSALRIQQDSPDLLFNTSQVLTSIAEATNEGKNPPRNDSNYALSLLQEALELFQRCLTLQEFKYNEAQDAANNGNPPAEDGDVHPSSSSGTASNASEEEIWASIEEPITKNAILDTVIAQLDTLTTICGLDTSQGPSNLTWIEEYYRTTLQAKIEFYSTDTSHHHDAALAKAKFISAISDAAFRSGRLDLASYERELYTAFNDPRLNLKTNPSGLCDRADAELSLHTSVHTSLANAQPAEMAAVGNTCWKHITKALDSLTQASKLPDALHLPRIHIRRGDCEMLRLRLGEAPLNYDLAIKSASTLLKNAAVYYRGAVNLVKKSTDDDEEREDGEVKEAVALALGGDAEKLVTMLKTRRDYVEMTLEEMRDENLLGEKGLEKIVSLAR